MTYKVKWKQVLNNDKIDYDERYYLILNVISITLNAVSIIWLLQDLVNYEALIIVQRLVVIFIS